MSCENKALSNDDGPDQLSHQRQLIIAFVILFLDSMIIAVSTLFEGTECSKHLSIRKEYNICDNGMRPIAYLVWKVSFFGKDLLMLL